MDFMTWVLAGAGIVVGLAIGWARGKQQLAGAISRAEYDKVSEERTTFAAKLESASAELEKTRSRVTELHERVITAEAEKKALEQRLKEQQEQMRLEFSNVANKIFENATTKFSTQSAEKIGHLLNPMQQHLNEFKKLVVDSFGAQGKEQHTLKSEIEKIVLQTDSLTKALRGDSKAQGNWGEVMLEKILEDSALRRDVDYIIQASEMSLSGADGNRLRPDVIVNLPDKKHIIIDSKVSLTAYDRYCGEAEELSKNGHLKEFLKSVKNHVNGLAEKRYQDIDKLGTPDFVLMFLPIEGAYSLAVQSDANLHAYAWDKRIVIVCPSTLFATLQTVASLWRIERQNKNAEEIARQAGRLYDKFHGFTEDMETIGGRLDGLQKVYDNAVGKLKSGRGNLVEGMEKLKQLGAKTTKSLSIQDTLLIEADADEPPAPRLAANE